MVVERIRARLRDDDVAARLGGDEFAILLRDEESLERATGVARRLIGALSSSFSVRAMASRWA